MSNEVTVRLFQLSFSPLESKAMNEEQDQTIRRNSKSTPELFQELRSEFTQEAIQKGIVSELLQAGERFQTGQDPDSLPIEDYFRIVLSFHILSHQPERLITKSQAIDLLPLFPVDDYSNFFYYLFQAYEIEDLDILSRIREVLLKSNVDEISRWLGTYCEYEGNFINVASAQKANVVLAEIERAVQSYRELPDSLKERVANAIEWRREQYAYH